MDIRSTASLTMLTLRTSAVGSGKPDVGKSGQGEGKGVKTYFCGHG